MAQQVHAQRIRGRKLQTLRERLLRNQPLCVACERKGRVTAAVHRDHIVALVNGGTDTEDNVQALCERCHADKTLADLGRRPKPALAADGWRLDRP